MAQFLDFSGREILENNIRSQWEDFRNKLAAKEFTYDDIDAALKTAFLGTFNEMCQNKYGYFNATLKDILTVKTIIVRAARIQKGEKEPDYNRFIPNCYYMKEHNRFSPPGVEWIYLSFSGDDYLKNDFSIAEICALKECRAKDGETFALCNFELDEKYKDIRIVDLTIASGIEFDKLNSVLEQVGEKAIEREIEKAKNNFSTNGYLVNIDDINIDDFKSTFRKWVVYTYAKLISEQIFVPLKTEDKSIMYAPFQCLAQYFKLNGYRGIVYSSTVYLQGKNIVLFDKNFVKPVGAIKKFTL